MGDKKLRKNSAEDSKPNLLKDQMASIRRSCAEVSNLLDRIQGTDEPDIDAVKAEYHTKLTTLWDQLASIVGVEVEEISDKEALDSCKQLIAGDQSFDEFCQSVAKFNVSSACGLVWNPNFVAYRCRTCGISPCMSLCAECFRGGTHEGHDYNMFRSQAGGACDCGDENVMKASGFCRRHGLDALDKLPKPPPELSSTARQILPHMLFRLLVHFRLKTTIDDDQLCSNSESVINQCKDLLNCLQNLADLGGPIRKTVVEAFLSSEYFEIFNTKYSNKRINDSYETAKGSLLPLGNCIDDAKSLECPSLEAEIQHNSMLQEICFWLARLEFPQPLVTFVLSMLPENDYKVAFTDAFAMHYGRVSRLLCQDSDNNLSNRVIHISVQLLSNGNLANRLIDQHRLHRVILSSLNSMLKACLIPSPMHSDEGSNEHFVVDSGHEIMRNNSYWALISDLHNLLAHREISLKFLRDLPALELWANILMALQGMNINERELEQHVEYESRDYYAAFTAEIEISASTLWCMMLSLKDQSDEDCILTAMQVVAGTLQEFFALIGFQSPSCWTPPPLQLTFHLPLHRFYASFLQKLLLLFDRIPAGLPSDLHLRQMFMHPLMIQVGRAEINAGMWVRNGPTTKYQSCLYVQNHFCAGFVDLDLFLMQIVSIMTDPDWVVLMIMERFHLIQWFSFSATQLTRPFLREDFETPMLESALRLIATLVCNTITTGSDADACRLELATLLAMKDCTHSQLMEQLPDKGIGFASTQHTPEMLEQHLLLIADYLPPKMDASGQMSQGLYVPKDIMWESYFDPILCMLRAMQLKDYNLAVERYTEYLKKKNQWKEKHLAWPQFKIPKFKSAFDRLRRLVHNRSLHALLFTILLRALRQPTTISEQTLQLAIFFLEIAVSWPLDETENRPTPAHSVVLDLWYSTWFPDDDLRKNLLHRIHRILAIHYFPGLSRSVDDGTESRFPDLLRFNHQMFQPSASANELALSPRSKDIPYIL